MKTDIFDLVGSEMYAQTCEAEVCDARFIKTAKLRNLLIYPRIEGCNKNAYLQNPETPTVEDFYNADGEWDFTNSFFLSEMLNGNIDEQKKKYLSDYFRYLNGLNNNQEKTEQNLLLVSDDYDADKQETILRCCGLPRNNTLLLWRSVAICLGAEEYLREKKAVDGNRVAVVDCSVAGFLNVSILTLKKDGDMLVPARSAFRKKDHYPIQNARLLSRSENTKKSGFQFWQHTWQTHGVHYVPDEQGNWSQQNFSQESFVCRSFDKLWESPFDFIILCGDLDTSIQRMFPMDKVIAEKEGEYFALRGAGRFSIRKAKGLPTYFDECESLYFIVQDVREEKIVPKELIRGNEFCKGGEVIPGNDNRDFYLEKEKDRISFYLYVGEISNTTPLKELTCHFAKEAVVKQMLTLHPSMIPGQGNAKVIVEAFPLLRENVELDFLKMQDACYEDKFKIKHPKTIQYLQDTLPRSFPIDFPDVEASYNLFASCQNSVLRYMNNERELDPGSFAQTRRPHVYSSGIERFERINVFGTKPGRQYPLDDKAFFHRLFEKIANDYRQQGKYKEHDYVRLAAWTYRCGIREFQELITNTIKKVQAKADGDSRVSLQQQDFTVCSNMLSEQEQQKYLLCFNQYTAPIIQSANASNFPITKVDWWLRGLMGILLYSNNFLKGLSSENCESCMDNLCNIWISYIEHSKKEQYILPVICCMLFLLRRRKYDHEFLRNSDSLLYKKIMGLRENLLFGNSLAIAFWDYVENKGSIDIPLGELLDERD